MTYWDTQKQINIKLGHLLKKITITKKKLLKTKKIEITENFGQNYIRKFQDELNSIDATFSSKQRVQHELDKFDHWVMTFGGNN